MNSNVMSILYFLLGINYMFFMAFSLKKYFLTINK